MLSNKIVSLLNEQVAKEMYASNLYLSMAAWCYENKLEGAGEFLFTHAGEEKDHATKLIKYLVATDSKVELQAIDKPAGNFGSLLEVFEKTLEHEIKITASINSLVETTLEVKDFSTFNFLQWYVSEQHEEEALFRGIVDKIKLIGKEGNGLYLADNYIKSVVGK